MKTKFLVLILLVAKFVSVNAQMDDKFYFPKKEMKTIEWKNVEEMKFPVENDTITALILKPNMKPKGTIFYFHGAGGNNTAYLDFTLPMVKDNFEVVMIDFRGYGKSTGVPTHKNIAEDGQKIFEALLKRTDIKDTKKIIYGASIGTQIATHLAKNNQNVLSGLVLEGTISSFGDIAGFYAPQYKDFLEKSFVSPYSAKEDVKSVAKIPTLFVHSKEDKEVPFEEGMMVYNNSPQQKEFVEFSGPHLGGMTVEGPKILEKIDKMINK